MSKPSRRIAPRTVANRDGSTSHLPAVSLIDATAPGYRWCGACSRKIHAGIVHVVARREGDANGVFDVAYCSLACRTRFVGGAL